MNVGIYHAILNVDEFAKESIGLFLLSGLWMFRLDIVHKHRLQWRKATRVRWWHFDRRNFKHKNNVMILLMGRYWAKIEEWWCKEIINSPNPNQHQLQNLWWTNRCKQFQDPNHFHGCETQCLKAKAKKTTLMQQSLSTVSIVVNFSFNS